MEQNEFAIKAHKKTLQQVYSICNKLDYYYPKRIKIHCTNEIQQNSIPQPKQTFETSIEITFNLFPNFRKLPQIIFKELLFYTHPDMATIERELDILIKSNKLIQLFGFARLASCSLIKTEDYLLQIILTKQEFITTKIASNKKYKITKPIDTQIFDWFATALRNGLFNNFQYSYSRLIEILSSCIPTFKIGNKIKPIVKNVNWQDMLFQLHSVKLIVNSNTDQSINENGSFHLNLPKLESFGNKIWQTTVAITTILTLNNFLEISLQQLEQRIPDQFKSFLNYAIGVAVANNIIIRKSEGEQVMIRLKS
eukprot:TRINITY_DN7202_c0_g1_i1.p1 TRINITY_DN7202_c0_g1~~TRINITY_DN7202_c0_g1_i1.p1  ORF type:complete len:310 (+),score=68.07 TRINITY_DN7202_c0_g1_i1:26-955(+)